MPALGQEDLGLPHSDVGVSLRCICLNRLWYFVLFAVVAAEASDV